MGRVLEPNEEDWWWLDTRHMAVSDVQVSTSLVHKHCRKGDSKTVMAR